MSPLEVAANVLNLLSVHLARKNSVHTWWIGVIACALFGRVFFEVKLYADLTLQIFFILTSIYGFWLWRFGGKSKDELPITRVHKRVFGGLIMLAIGCTVAYGALLHRWTDASLPFVDSIVLTFSILAQFLLMGRKIENWSLWIVVNVVSVPLFFYKGLYLTSFIYALFLINALIARKQWLRLMQGQ